MANTKHKKQSIRQRVKEALAVFAVALLLAAFSAYAVLALILDYVVTGIFIFTFVFMLLIDLIKHLSGASQ